MPSVYSTSANRFKPLLGGALPPVPTRAKRRRKRPAQRCPWCSAHQLGAHAPWIRADTRLGNAGCNPGCDAGATTNARTISCA